MKNILVLLLSCLIFCQACTNTETLQTKVAVTTQSVSDTPVNKSFDQEVSLDKMKVNLPLKWSKKEETTSSILYSNKLKNNLILLDKEFCLAGYDQCVAFSLRSLMKTDANILTVEEVMINDNEFLLVIFSREGIKIWSWLTYHNSYLYAFSCGGLEEDVTNQKTCAEIASSLKLK